MDQIAETMLVTETTAEETRKEKEKETASARTIDKETTETERGGRMSKMTGKSP